MAYVPKDAEWFLADLVEKIRVAGSKRNIVHINSVIIRATSPELAYKRAIAMGRQHQLSYLNPKGKMVTIRFRGLGNLDVIHDPLDDGCEVMFREKLSVSERDLRRMLRPKQKLEVFQPIRPRRGRPDFTSKQIMDEVAKRIRDGQISKH
jgi:hypothetical protein